MKTGAELSESTKERWRTAGRFADVLEAEVKAPRNPIIARVVSWFNFCRLCQDLEEQLLLRPELAPEDLHLHRALLSSAIGSGERLLLECQDAKVLAPLQLTPESITAKLESLRITFEQWHTAPNSERQEAILKEVFGGAA